MHKPVVLFVCTGNSARSQMAEGLLRHHAGETFDVRSAGTDPKGVNPLAVETVKEIGVDISQQQSKKVSEVMEQVSIQYAIFVCASADDRCPTLGGFSGQRLYWPFEDPAAATGTKQERLQAFRDVRDQIDARIRAWLAELRVPGKL
ncbi:MAG: arsenate reductase ArsC [Pirellulales bacterium]